MVRLLNEQHGAASRMSQLHQSFGHYLGTDAVKLQDLVHMLKVMDGALNKQHGEVLLWSRKLFYRGNAALTQLDPWHANVLHQAFAGSNPTEKLRFKITSHKNITTKQPDCI